MSDSDGGGVVFWDIRPKQQGFIEKLRSRIRRLMLSDSAREREFETLRLTTLCSIPQSESKKQRYVLAFSSCGKYLASGTWWQKGWRKRKSVYGALLPVKISTPSGTYDRCAAACLFARQRTADKWES